MTLSENYLIPLPGIRHLDFVRSVQLSMKQFSLNTIYSFFSYTQTVARTHRQGQMNRRMGKSEVETDGGEERSVRERDSADDINRHVLRIIDSLAWTINKNGDYFPSNSFRGLLLPVESRLKWFSLRHTHVDLARYTGAPRKCRRKIEVFDNRTTGWKVQIIRLVLEMAAAEFQMALRSSTSHFARNHRDGSVVWFDSGVRWKPVELKCKFIFVREEHIRPIKRASILLRVQDSYERERTIIEIPFSTMERILKTIVCRICLYRYRS